jgi:hypothetical protein
MDLQTDSGPPGVSIKLPDEPPTVQPSTCPTNPKNLLNTRVYALLFQAMTESGQHKMNPMWHAWY